MENAEEESSEDTEEVFHQFALALTIASLVPVDRLPS